MRPMTLMLACTVAALIPLSQAGAQVTEPGAPSLVPAAVMKAGDARRYRVDEQDTVTADSGPTEHRASQVVELKVITAGDHPVIRDTLVSMDHGANLGDDSPGVLLGRALLNLPMDYEANASGAPVAMPDWPKFKGQIKARLSHLDRTTPAAIGQITEIIDGMDEHEALANLVGEGSTVGDMQSWDLSVAHAEAPVRTTGDGDTLARTRFVRDVVGPPAACLVKLRALVELDPNSPAALRGHQIDKRATEATVSTQDGWVISLTETRDHTEGETLDHRVQTFTRVDTTPACPG